VIVEPANWGTTTKAALVACGFRLPLPSAPIDVELAQAAPGSACILPRSSFVLAAVFNPIGQSHFEVQENVNQMIG
jgi:hypothetical protein